MRLKELPNTDSLRDSDGVLYASLIEVDATVVGAYKKAKFGPGVFLCIFGTTWQNAPGARYPEERDRRMPYTYCRNKSIMTERVRTVLRERERLAQETANG